MLLIFIVGTFQEADVIQSASNFNNPLRILPNPIYPGKYIKVELSVRPTGSVLLNQILDLQECKYRFVKA